MMSYSRNRAKRTAGARTAAATAIEARLEFYAAWKLHNEAGFDPSREECAKLAAMFGVDPPPLAKNS